MKKLFLITLIFTSLQLVAQNKTQAKKVQNSHAMSSYSAEEIAEIQTKKLTLALDLTKEQQKQIMPIQIENAKMRKNNLKAYKKKSRNVAISKEEKLEIKNDMLDRQIATKQSMKKILNDEQFTKWEKIRKKQWRKSRRNRK